MTLLHQPAQKAVEALKKAQPRGCRACDWDPHNAAIATLESALQQQEVPSPVADLLITTLIRVGKDGVVHADVQTHDNSYAEIAIGLAASRRWFDETFEDQKRCPYHPADAEAAHRKILRGVSSRSTTRQQEAGSGSGNGAACEVERDAAKCWRQRCADNGYCAAPSTPENAGGVTDGVNAPGESQR